MTIKMINEDVVLSFLLCRLNNPLEKSDQDTPLVLKTGAFVLGAELNCRHSQLYFVREGITTKNHNVLNFSS